MNNKNLVIENGEFRLETRPLAGEMVSLIDLDSGREILYQGDQGWSGRNPSLFPMIGKTWNDGKYEIDGKTYQMKNHGLIRYCDLNGRIENGQIVYTLDSDENTRKQYPFDFHFELCYALTKCGVQVSYGITNTGDRPMPFSFGLHPAFKTKQNPGEEFEDFSVKMKPVSEAVQVLFLNRDHVEKKPVLLDEWKLSRKDLAENDTMVYEDFKADQATLCYKDEPRVTMHFHGYPWLALWSCSTPSDYVCIEPWFGHSDFEDVQVPFEQREGTQILQPGETFKAEYEIEVHR